ncbi:SRPBCC family protein [Paraburkholderia sp. BR14374]|uniref:aromatic ring-hydroxylating oxygenase subunit alpha n=1 Tax=Paraburkholderia sp. BR14374 TaxID=3237007 RepID=UPI0034CE25D7
MNVLEVYKSLAKRLLAHLDAKTVDSAPDIYRQPTAVYSDKELFEGEKNTIFKDEPYFVGFSSELPEPGTYFTWDDAGVPVLLVRDNEGKMRAFLNACTHRSARIKEGSGKLRAMSCPYHGWGFDLKGKLRSIYEESSFGNVDKELYNLVELPSHEKYGMIFVGLHAGVKVDIDTIFGDLAPVFASWDLGSAQLVKEHSWHIDTNWKLALDTFCEGYHFGILHKELLAFQYGNVSAFDTFGPNGRNHRLAFPNHTIDRLRNIPEDQWDDQVFQDFQLVHYIYPNTSILVSLNSIEFFQLYPGKEVGTHHTRYRCFWRGQGESLGAEKSWSRGTPEDHANLIIKIVDTEDYWISMNVMRNLKANIIKFSTFGKNEPALQNMHKAFAIGAGRSPEQYQLPATQA